MPSFDLTNELILISVSRLISLELETERMEDRGIWKIVYAALILDWIKLIIGELMDIEEIEDRGK